MPYLSEWVEPGLFLEHAGVNVWHTYKNDEADQGPRSYWFTLDVLCGEGSCSSESCEPHKGGSCCNVFDVRNLPGYQPQTTDEEFYHKDVIRQAIDAGLLTKDGVSDLGLTE
jgi:hypothetical protein